MKVKVIFEGSIPVINGIKNKQRTKRKEAGKDRQQSIRNRSNTDDPRMIFRIKICSKHFVMEGIGKNPEVKAIG